MQTPFQLAILVSACACATAAFPRQESSCAPSAEGSAFNSDDAVTLLQTTVSSHRRSEGNEKHSLGKTLAGSSPAAAVSSALTALQTALDTAMKQRDAALRQRDEMVSRAKQAMLHATQEEKLMKEANKHASEAAAQAKKQTQASKQEAEKKDAALRKTLHRWETALTSAKQAMKQRDMALSEAQKKLKHEDEEMRKWKQQGGNMARENGQLKQQLMQQHKQFDAAMVQRDQVLQKTSHQRDAALTEAKKATASLQFIEGELEEMKKVMKQSMAARSAYKQAMAARETAAKRRKLMDE